MCLSSCARVITVMAAGALLQPVFGQARGGAAPSTGAPSTGTGTTGATTGRTAPPNSTNPSGTSTTTPTPIYVSGRVMIDDGTPLPETVVVQRVCSGQPHALGYTDAKGYFSFDLSNRSLTVVEDASEFGGGLGRSGLGGMSPTPVQTTSTTGLGSNPGFGDRRLVNCELQAKLAGYRSQVINLGNRREMDDPNVGTILLHRVGAAEGNTVSAVSLAAPKDAKRAFDHGMDALKKQKPEQAQKDLAKAVELYPQYAAAWQELGKLQVASQPETARKSFGKAIEADPKFAAPYMQLTVMALHEKNWQEVAQLTDKVEKLDPFTYPNAFFFNAVANYNLKHLDIAEQSAAQAEKLDTQHLMPQCIQLLGMLHALRGDYTGAAAQFRNYLKIAPDGPEAAQVRSQLVEVEKIVAGVGEMKKEQ